MYSNHMLELCSQSELWRLCAGEVKHNDYGIYDTNAQAARKSENSATEQALTKDPNPS